MGYNGNGAAASGPIRSISGASLAQRLRHMSAPARAVLGAAVLDGTVVVNGLTAKSIAELVGVNQSYLFAAARLSPAAREEVVAGQRSLNRSRPPATPKLDQAWSGTDYSKQLEFTLAHASELLTFIDKGTAPESHA
jgi:hypothetical protein